MTYFQHRFIIKHLFFFIEHEHSSQLNVWQCSYPVFRCLGTVAIESYKNHWCTLCCLDSNQTTTMLASFFWVSKTPQGSRINTGLKLQWQKMKFRPFGVLLFLLSSVCHSGSNLAIIISTSQLASPPKQLFTTHYLIIQLTINSIS